MVKNFNNYYAAFVYWEQCIRSRNQARRIRKNIVRAKGFSQVDQSLKKEIKQYCRSVFGSAAYWPWLATYTEIRGEYKEGWIPDDYMSYRAMPIINPRNITYISLLKTLDYRLFGDFCVAPLMLIIGKLIYDKNFNIISREKAEKLLKEHADEVVVKEDGGSGGSKVYFVPSHKVDLNKLSGNIRCVIQPLVYQHKSLTEIYPSAINTLRIHTYMGSDSVVRIIISLLRVGTNGSRVDNVHRGGRFLYLNDEGKPATDAITGWENMGETKHPDTGYAYKDIKISALKKAKELCIKAHYQYPYTGIIAWDIYIDTNNNPRLLEWNAKSLHFGVNEAFCGPQLNPHELTSRIGKGFTPIDMIWDYKQAGADSY